MDRILRHLRGRTSEFLLFPHNDFKYLWLLWLFQDELKFTWWEVIGFMLMWQKILLYSHQKEFQSLYLYSSERSANLEYSVILHNWKVFIPWWNFMSNCTQSSKKLKRTNVLGDKKICSFFPIKMDQQHSYINHSKTILLDCIVMWVISNDLPKIE